MDLRRPDLKEDDEEGLLRTQEEFLAKKDAKLSVHLDLSKRAEKRKSESTDQELGACRGNFLSGGGQNRSPTKTEKDVTKMEVEPPAGMAVGELPSKKSKFARERQQGGLLGSQVPGIGEDVLQKHQKSFGSLQIIERDTSRASVQRPQVSMQPFPIAERIDTAQLQGRKAGQKGQSLFAQINRQLKKTAGTAVGESAMETGEAGADAKVSGTSCIVTGSGLSASFGVEEARKIHMENAEKLASMTQEEILAEQQKLLQEIDPKLLEFLKSKRRGPGVASGEAKSEKQREKKSVRFESATKSSSNAMEEDKEVKVPFEVKGEWLHMDKVEKDKLAWMKDLPSPSAPVSEQSQARFDFHGNVVPADQDVPVNLGLHHHGEEPERAGYTLQELFTLARSANVQQRTLALNTLTRILARAKEGSYRDLLQTAVLPSVTSAGLVFLLRMALDDSVDSVQAAALAALASFVASPGDEACLDHTFGWVHGHVAPTLCPAPVPDKEEEEDADKPAETDATVAERDVVFALVRRMSLLQRLLYIMKHRSPPAPTVLSCLAILTRVARHSPAMAYEIMHCPGLVDFIFDNFLPLSWNPVEPDSPVSSAHGLPLPAAMRLACAVCQAGRSMATILVARFKLGDRILQYLSAEPGKLQLKSGEAILLQTESYRTWTICLGYGLTSNIFSHLYGKVVEELRQMRGAVPCLQPDPSLLQCQVAMVTALDMAVHVAASAKPNTGLQAGDAGQQGESVALTWQEVEHLAQQLQGLSVALLTDLAHNHQHQKRNLQLLTACVKFMGSFHGKISSRADYDPVTVLTQVEAFFNEIIKTSWKCLGFRSVMLSLNQNSNLLSPPDWRNRELAASTGGLGGSVPGSDCLLPVLRCHSPFGLLSALLRWLLQLSRLHKGLLLSVQRLLLDDADLLSYLRKVAQNKPSPLHDNHFTLHENLLQFYCLQIFALKPSEEITGVCYMHALCLLLLQRLPQGLAHFAHVLLTTFVFSRDFIESELKLGALMSGLSLNPRPGEDEDTDTLPSNAQLLKQTIDYIPSIRNVYLDSLSPLLPAADKSRHQLEQSVEVVDSLVMAGGGHALLPKDWVFLPIINLYSASLSPSAAQDSKPSEQVVRVVLQWAFFLESIGSSAVTTLSPTFKLTRLLCTFLAGPDFFLDPKVQGLLWSFLCRFTQPRFLQNLNFMEPVPGISSFYDLYISLLQQYQAVSYSDPVFCTYVLLPLMQSQNVQLRLAVWGEHSAILRSLNVSLHKLPMPLECFLEPVETDLELLSLYLSFLVAPSTGSLLQGPPSWPVLVAVHHLNHFLYLETNVDAPSVSRMALWGRLLHSPHPAGKNSIVAWVVHYKKVNLSLTQSCGLEMYDRIPDNRFRTLNAVLGFVKYDGKCFRER